MQNDAAALSRQLHKALGWDAAMVGNVVQAVTAAAQTGNAQEIEELVQVRVATRSSVKPRRTAFLLS